MGNTQISRTTLEKDDSIKNLFEKKDILLVLTLKNSNILLFLEKAFILNLL